MNVSKKVLVSGASLAGLTLAYWLNRYGFTVTIVERAPALRDGGNGVDVQDQALQVAERMGILPLIKKAATDVQGMSFVNERGNSLARIDMAAIQQASDPGQTEIMRGELARILYDLVKDTTKMLFNDSITAIDQNNAGARVTFEHAPARTFDLVIGADGFHSTVRRLVFGPEKQFTHYLGYYAAFADAPADMSENRWMTIYNEPGRMAGLYRSGNQAGAKSYFLFRQAEPLTYDYHNMDEQNELLRTGMAGMKWHTAALLDRAMLDPAFYFDSLSQIRMPSWSQGRVALVGDAAYCASPVTGAGALLAMVGAYRLAGELYAAKGDHIIGYKAYETGMRPLAARKQAQPFTGLLAPKSKPGIAIRNLTARSPLLRMASGLEQRFSGKQEALPNYQSA